MSLKSGIPGDHVREASVVIEGVPLSFAESMTLRVAIDSFAMTLTAEGLGDDAHGRSMTENYLHHLKMIRHAISKGAK